VGFDRWPSSLGPEVGQMIYFRTDNQVTTREESVLYAPYARKKCRISSTGLVLGTLLRTIERSSTEYSSRDQGPGLFWWFEGHSIHSITKSPHCFTNHNVHIQQTVIHRPPPRILRFFRSARWRKGAYHCISGRGKDL
jgi:hypothetical protein